MLLDQVQLCIVKFVCHIVDDTGDDGSGDAEPFLPAAASGSLLNAFKQWALGDVIEDVGHCYQGDGG